MKSTNKQNNFEISQVMNLSDALMQLQHYIEKDEEKVNTPQLKNVKESSSMQSCKNANKFEKSKLYIKNMVSVRCKMVVKAVLENLGLKFLTVELGEVEIVENISQEKRDLLKADLLKFGLELLEDNKSVVVEKIKNVVVEVIHYEDELPKIKFSDYLSEKLNQNYTYLSHLFSEVKGMTIEHFIISHKIERVKELLVYHELTLSEIAWKLRYSSVAHLSNQFKKITGSTPTHFKEMKNKRLRALDNL